MSTSHEIFRSPAEGKSKDCRSTSYGPVTLRTAKRWDIFICSLLSIDSLRTYGCKQIFPWDSFNNIGRYCLSQKPDFLSKAFQLKLLFLNGTVAAAAAKSLQLCPTLCDPIDSSPPGSPVTGILQARTLGWVAISFSNVWKWKVKVKSLSCVQLVATPWTAAYQATPSMGFSRQEYWSGVPLVQMHLFAEQE